MGFPYFETNCSYIQRVNSLQRREKKPRADFLKLAKLSTGDSGATRLNDRVFLDEWQKKDTLEINVEFHVLKPV